MKVYFKVNPYADAYIAEKVKKLKSAIVTSWILTFILPLVFITLKSNFFSIPINILMIIIGIGLSLMSIVVGVRSAYQRLETLRNFIKEISIDGSIISFISVNEKEISGQLNEFYLYEGYKGSVNMKNIFENELIFGIENTNKGLKNYIISNHFDSWEELKTTFNQGKQ